MRVGGRPLELARGAEPARDGARVAIERGSVVELYRLERHGVEQGFRFDELPLRGELTIRIGLSTELEAQADADGFLFVGELGGARYGKAVAIDATGRVVDASCALVEGALELRVERDFVERAELPLLVDPWITTFAVDSSPADDMEPDVAYDASLDVYVVCWERAFSVSDRDVHGAVLDGAGNLLREFALDLTAATHARPKVAGIDALDRFLVVSLASSDGFDRAVGRVVDLAGGLLALGPPVVLGEDYLALTHDLGGDPGASPPHRWCLVISDTGIGCDLVWVGILGPDAQTETWQYVGDCDYEPRRPKIAKRATVTATGERRWPVVVDDFLYEMPEGLLAFQASSDSGLLPGSFVSLGAATDRSVAVTSALDGTGDGLPYLVLSSSGSTLQARVVGGASPIGAPLALSAGAWSGGDADSDGASFVVSFAEEAAQHQVVAATLNLSDPGAGGPGASVSELARLASSSEPLLATAITSERSGGGAPPRCFVAWEAVPAGTGDIGAALYDSPGPGNRYCTSAPNSVGPGARIAAAGGISISLDAFELRVEGCPPAVMGLFYLGTSQTMVPFGEGFRCVGAPTRRISPPLATDPTGAASLVLDFDLSYGELVVPGPPGVNYQLWYRDPAAGPAGFNLSDALNVIHTP